VVGGEYVVPEGWVVPNAARRWALTLVQWSMTWRAVCDSWWLWLEHRLVVLSPAVGRKRFEYVLVNACPVVSCIAAV